MTYFCDLPDEVIEIVFYNADAGTLANIRQASRNDGQYFLNRRIYEISNDVLETKYFGFENSAGRSGAREGLLLKAGRVHEDYYPRDSEACDEIYDRWRAEMLAKYVERYGKKEGTKIFEINHNGTDCTESVDHVPKPVSGRDPSELLVNGDDPNELTHDIWEDYYCKHYDEHDEKNRLMLYQLDALGQLEDEDQYINVDGKTVYFTVKDSGWRLEQELADLESRTEAERVW